MRQERSHARMLKLEATPRAGRGVWNSGTTRPRTISGKTVSSGESWDADALEREIFPRPKPNVVHGPDIQIRTEDPNVVPRRSSKTEGCQSDREY